MSPEFFEAILFLYYNRDMWSVGTVHQAHCSLRQEKKEERLAEKLKNVRKWDSDSEVEEEEEEEEEDMDDASA